MKVLVLLTLFTITGYHFVNNCDYFSSTHLFTEPVTVDCEVAGKSRFKSFTKGGRQTRLKQTIFYLQNSAFVAVALPYILFQVIYYLLAVSSKL